ncbi:hypothetical protein INT45_004423 [Circinella minor]|uniref:Uncharacterized protein n=1 Tax=Circinella minor TaxID=1195481 RepID=A0A8H7RU51_9FUNG|nr:hypothetical protein INT45_004423 [Circinella minor]
MNNLTSQPLLLLLLSILLLGKVSFIEAQEEPTRPTVDPTGFNPAEGTPEEEKKSWLEQHGRFAFIIVIGLLILGLLIWYVARSVKSMRKRLAMENDNQMQMINQIAAGQQDPTQHNHPTPPDNIYPSSTSMKKDDTIYHQQQQHNQQASTSPVTPTSPPPRY